MKRLTICIYCVFIISLSCIPKQTSKSSKGKVGFPVADGKSGTITIFFTGNELGELKPCGCSGGQLGGLDRRSAIFNSVPEDQRLIIDTGTLVKSDGEQDIIKFNIMIQAFDLLGYDLLCLSEDDLEIVVDKFGSLEGYSSILNIIAPSGISSLDTPTKFAQMLEIEDKYVTISVATIDVNSTPIEFVEELYFARTDHDSEPKTYPVNILILNRCNPELIDSIAQKAPSVDCLICPSESDEPIIIDDPNKKPLAFTIGRKGRHITILEIDTSQIEDKPILTFKTQSVTEDLEQDQVLIDLYKDYQKFVKEHNLLEKYPRYTLPDGLHYTGSESCSTCHQYEYIEWMSSAHADAYATLERVGSQYDPECVKCHVIGMDYDSGFISGEKTPIMKDVGCEVCHGPGSRHNWDPNGIKTTVTDPKSICIQCHTPEHSSDYAGHEEEKLQLIDHWSEPNAVSDVK